MPRKSAAEALVSPGVQPKIRPDAHYDLRDDEAAIWRVMVDTMPPDWFNAAQQFLLARFCKAVVTARKIDDDLEFEEARKRQNRSVVRQLRSMQMRATTEVARLETKMRIAHQSSYLPEKAARKLVRQSAHDAGSEVWDLNGDADVDAD